MRYHQLVIIVRDDCTIIKDGRNIRHIIPKFTRLTYLIESDTNINKIVNDIVMEGFNVRDNISNNIIRVPPSSILAIEQSEV